MKTKHQRRAAERRKKVKEYARFLKDDFDFDWTYILDLLRYKLQRTRRSIAKGKTECTEQKCAEIKRVEDLLWAVTQEGYEQEELDAFQRKHGKSKMVTTPVPGRKGVSKLHFTYGGKQPTKKMNDELHQCFLRANKRQQADLDRACALLAKNVRGWWI